jgi:predicted 3-demethylubiquinone-9 3-methyltransferase (glyoxalase superfamily)
MVVVVMTMMQEELDKLADKFVSDVAQGKHKEEGWPNSTYGVSKIAVSALTRVLARQEAKNTSRYDAHAPPHTHTHTGD